MLRSVRLEPVLDAARDSERRAGLACAGGEQRLAEAEKTLADLQLYEQEYRANLLRQSAAGIPVERLRDFHRFIGRLGDAILQQGVAAQRAREERDALRARWLEAARRARSVGLAIEHASTAERQVQDRREQAEHDERALRAFASAAFADPEHGGP